MIHPFLKFLEKRLQSPLPGTKAQEIMAPEPYEGGNPRVSIPLDALQSAVLVLFSNSGRGDLEVLYTLRSNKMLHHRGQISFPGGRAEKGEYVVHTALRETCEEVGISPEHITVLGSLTSLYVPPSKSVINPVVGFVEKMPVLRLQESEVSEAFTISIDELYSEKNRRNEHRLLQGRRFRVPFWNVHATPLWGATAMITSEAVELYREFRHLDV